MQQNTCAVCVILLIPEFLLTDTFSVCQQVELRFAEEESRVHQYLSLKTRDSLAQILCDTLLASHLEVIVRMPASGLDVMIDAGRTDDLSRLYRMCAMVSDGISILRKVLKDVIQKHGAEMSGMGRVGLDDQGDEGVEADEGGEGARKGKGKKKVSHITGAQTLALALKWVEDILALKDKFDKILKECFSNDREVENGLNEVCSISYTIESHSDFQVRHLKCA